MNELETCPRCKAGNSLAEGTIRVDVVDGKAVKKPLFYDINIGPNGYLEQVKTCLAGCGYVRRLKEADRKGEK